MSLKTMLHCQWCGAFGTEDEFELDEEHGDGFWCPDCDGHTYFDPERNKHRRVLLLLERNGKDEGPPKPRQKITSKRLSPLRYPGGKSKLIDFLLEQFREQQMDAFVEPFAGGASVGLAMLDAGLTKRLVLNDADFGVYAFWKCVCEAPQLLLERLKGPTPTRKDFFVLQHMLLNADAPPVIPEYAWAQLVCNRLSFSGITMANPLGEKTGLLARWNPETLAKRITHIHSMADRIEVSNLDANKVIEEEYWGDKTTLFIDPPYVNKGAALYPKAFTEDDHRELAFNIECLYTGMPGGDIIITYDDHQLIRELYPFAEIQTIGRRYSCKKTAARERRK